MNRIYQGRVTCVQKLKAGAKGTRPEDWEPFDPDPKQARNQWEAALWQHHALFQDAVNYYVVCLLALAGPRNASLWQIRQRLNATVTDDDGTLRDDDLMVWRPFRRRGALRSGMRDSVAPYLCPGQPDATPEDCFAAVLKGNEASAELRSLALEELLFICDGDNPIKNQGRWMFDRFCNPEYTGSYPFDATADLRKLGEKKLKTELHRLGADQFAEFAKLVDLGWVVNLTKGAAPFEGEAARDRLLKALAHFQQVFGKKSATEIGDRMAQFLKQSANAECQLAELEQRVRKLPAAELPKIPANNRGVADRVEACLLFKFFPNPFTADLLKIGFPKETEEKAVKPKSSDDPKVRFTRFGGDAIELARGARGYVFRAFTSLSTWDGDDSGKTKWLPFDVLAFKEALKALHQINSKRKERADKRADALAQLEYQRQCTFRRENKPDGSEEIDLKVEKAVRAKMSWQSIGEESTPPPVLAGDPRIARLEELLSGDLAEEYEMSEGISVEYGLQQRTIRGFRDLRKNWIEVLAKNNTRDYSVALHEELKQKLRDFQKENPTIVGSVRLFEALLEKDNWLIWREPTADEINQWRKEAGLPKDVRFSDDPLQALTDERELLADIDRLSGPIRFTPAHPEHSRRQFYFSDVTDLTAKNRLRHDRQTVDVELAVKEDGVWKKKEVRLHFSAPRLLRDQLNNASGKDALFQQAMMEALGISTKLTAVKKKKVVEGFEHCAAVALMPEVRNDDSKRILLNFPLTLDGESIARQLGKAERWHDLQFGGADGESYWLRWPKTWIDEKKERKKAPPAPWWTNPQPFQVLSVDLGQRDAGAFALLEATPGDPPKPQSRKLGEAGDKTWWATVKATGVLHLPGEDAKLRRDRTAFDEEDDDAKELEELSGHRGRTATEAEWTEARDICERLGLVADKVLGKDRGRYSFPELNDQLLYALYRAQQRLARLQGWSCVAWEETDKNLKAKFEKRRARIKEQIAEAITHRAEEAAKPEDEREQEILDRGRWLDEAKPFVERNAWDCVADCIRREIENEHAIIQAQLVRIADRIQPLRGEWDDDRVRDLVQRLAAEANLSSPVTRALAAKLAALVAANDSAKAVHLFKQHLSRDPNEIPADLLRLAEEIRPFLRRRWKWEQRSDGKNHWLVIEKTGVACYEPVKLAGQRGLSLARIEQLDSLRQRCISLNRALRQNIGEPAKLGKSKRGIELPDPCPDILDRLDALKEQRVNQTAHLIVAQALGVRLKPHEKDEHERAARDIHGEYERIPGRQPVDFIAIENLEYYNMTQRRERSTNARLMKWCRRQLRNKLIMLCEPYGLRVVEVWPADTSKFCSLTGVAGFRAVELNPDDAENFRWKKHLLRLREADARKRNLDAEDRKESERIKALFDKLTELNKDLLAERDKARAEGRHFRPKWRTLLAPMPLGPLFVPASATETITRSNKKSGKDEQVVAFKTVNGRRPTVLQADINAAINIGLHAIASPHADDIHTRIRAKSDGKAFAVRADNKREEARWGDSPPPIVVKDAASREKLLTDKWLNFYFDIGEVADFDHAAIDGIENRVASGRGLWGSIKGNDKRAGKDWQRCMAINAARLRSWGLIPPAGWENDDVPFAP